MFWNLDKGNEVSYAVELHPSFAVLVSRAHPPEMLALPRCLGKSRRACGCRAGSQIDSYTCHPSSIGRVRGVMLPRRRWASIFAGSWPRCREITIAGKLNISIPWLLQRTTFQSFRSADPPNGQFAHSNYLSGVSFLQCCLQPSATGCLVSQGLLFQLEGQVTPKSG